MFKGLKAFAAITIVAASVSFTVYEIVQSMKFHKEEKLKRKQIRKEGELLTKSYEKAGEFLTAEMKAGRYMPSSFNQLTVDIEALALGYRAEEN